MEREKQDIVSENCVFNDAGELALTDEQKMSAWVEHYSTLLNIEFEWPVDLLPVVPPIAGNPPPVTSAELPTVTDCPGTVPENGQNFTFVSKSRPQV